MKKGCIILTTREKLQKIQGFLKNNNDLKPVYTRAKKFINIYSHSSFYEISHKCNLECEGCYFFDDDFGIIKKDDTSLKLWEDLFIKERERGVLMGSMFGAEPAMEQERLKIATKYITYGNIGTNGTIKLDDEIKMRIHISAWGDVKIDKQLRGTNVLERALKNYANDSRAIVAYTVNSSNIHDIEAVTKRCQEHNIPITFSMYSPAIGYKKDIDSSNNNLIFTEYSLQIARDTIDELILKYPEIIYYTHNQNHWITNPGSLYTLDDKDIAVDCGSRYNGSYRGFSADTQEILNQKCVHSSLDCSECRVYGAASASRFMPLESDLVSEKTFIEWLNLMDMMYKIFIYDN